MSMSVDEQIAHLDFPIVDDEKQKAPDCDGWLHTTYSTGVIRDSRDVCQGKAQLFCIRSCCGVVEQLCIPCYNKSASGGGIRGETSRCKFNAAHNVQTPKYSRVDRL